MLSARRFAVFVLLTLALPVSAHAAITHVGSCSAVATSCTLSVAPSSGDAIVVCAFRNGNTAPPTLPSGYQVIQAATGSNTSSMTVAVRISNGTETTSGTWNGTSTATSVAAVVYRGANVAPVGNFAANGASSVTVNYPALSVFNSNSWVIGCAAHKTATNVNQAPSGMTLVTGVGAVNGIAISDTNAGVASWASTNVTVNTTGAWQSYTLELLAQTGEDTTKLYVDDYVHLNTADATPSTLTPTIFTNGTSGADTWANCYADDTNTPGVTTPNHTVDAHQWNAPATIHVRSPSTDFTVGSTTRTERFNHNGVNFRTCRIENLLSNRHHGAVTMAGWVLLGPPDDGASGSLYDYWRVDNVDGNFCVFQLNNGDGGTGYHVRIESNPGGVTVQSSNITPTPATRYWVVLYCNFQAATSSLALYDTSGVQVGSTVTGSLAYTQSDNPDGAYIDSIRVGNAETKTDTATTIWEHTIIDYSAAKFPLGPSVTGGAGCYRSLRGVGC